MISRIFVGQSALRFEADTGLDSGQLTGAQALLIKYSKPDGSTGSWTATEDSEEVGVIYYDVINTSELDQAGSWLMWAHVTFSDGRVAQGRVIRVRIYTEGEIM